jgi:hypothetical protein
MLGGPQNGSEHFGEAENLLLLPGIELRCLIHEACSLVAIVPELLWLPECRKFEIYCFIQITYRKANCDSFSIADITLF